MNDSFEFGFESTSVLFIHPRNKDSCPSCLHMMNIQLQPYFNTNTASSLDAELSLSPILVFHFLVALKSGTDDIKKYSDRNKLSFLNNLVCKLPCFLLISSLATSTRILFQLIWEQHLYCLYKIFVEYVCTKMCKQKTHSQVSVLYTGKN